MNLVRIFYDFVLKNLILFKYHVVGLKSSRHNHCMAEQIKNPYFFWKVQALLGILSKFQQNRTFRTVTRGRLSEKV